MPGTNKVLYQILLTHLLSLALLAELLDYRICTTPALSRGSTESHHTADC